MIAREDIFCSAQSSLCIGVVKQSAKTTRVKLCDRVNFHYSSEYILLVNDQYAATKLFRQVGRQIYFLEVQK